MILTTPLRLAVALALAGSACTRQVAVRGDAPPEATARYLFAWTGDDDRAQEDFLTVVDLQPQGDRYGTIVATAPVGEKGLWPHHTEHALGAGKTLFANGYAANRNLVFDLHDPLQPKVTARFNGAGDLGFMHSIVRLPNGHALATFQAHGAENVGTGGLAELDETGRVIRSTSAADPTADQETLRPYGLAVVASLDRVVVALTYMPIPTWHRLRTSIAHDHDGNQVQVYRLSDLSLIRTIRLPGNDAPNEPRVLADGRTVLVGTVACRLYEVTGLDGSAPAVELVHDEGARGCAMPVVIGNYWVQAQAAEHRVYALDISNLKRVRAVSSLPLDERQRPHWLAVNGSRIVMLNEPGSAWERRMWMLHLDRTNGQLALDSAFRDAGSTRPGLAFDRPNWPHGASGTAVPHGTVFSR